MKFLPFYIVVLASRALALLLANSCVGVKWFGLWGLIFGILTISYGQRLPTPEALSTKEGLGFRSVTGITQSKDGFMWFATRNGLDRYDGFRFMHFGPETQNGLHFPATEFLSNAIHNVADTLLWTIADDRLFNLDIRTLAVRESPHFQDKICLLNRGRDNDLWVVTDGELTQTLWHYAPGGMPESVATVAQLRRPFSSLGTDSTGNVWWSTVTEGLQQYSPRGQLLHSVKVDSFIWYGTKMYFTPLFLDRSDRLFLFPKSKHQICQYFPATHEVKVWKDSLNSPVYQALEDSEGNLWFATGSELFQWAKNGEWTDYSSVLHQALEFNDINCLFEDRTNILWVGTNGGLIKVPIRKQLFDHFLTTAGAHWGDAMRGIVEGPDGQLFFYSEKGSPGLYAYSPPTGNLSKLNFGLPQNEVDQLLESCMHYVYDAARNCLWTLNRNLLKIDLANLRLEEIELPWPVGQKNGFNALCLLTPDKLLFGTSMAELSILDLDTYQVHKIDSHLQQTKYVDNRIKVLLPGNEDTFWVGTKENGIFQLNHRGELIQHFSTETPSQLSNDHILHLLAHKDYLWVGTFGGGLNGIHLPSGRVDIFTKDDGLADNHVVAILPDNGNLWVATYFGLSCFDPLAETFQNFYEEDGLSNNEFNYASACRSSDGYLYFGGMNGVNSFYPANLQQSTLNPPLQLISFSKYDHQRDSLFQQRLSVPMLEPIVISPYISYLQFDWALPNYFKPEKHQYFTWLEGQEADWTYLGNMPSIRFNRLAPGRYTLHIRGTDRRGNPAAGELTIPIVVKAVFYRRWWFVSLMAFSLAGAVFIFSRYRYQRRLEMERVRTKIASDLHDEVGSMLSGLAMQAEILELQNPSIDHAKLSYLKEISRSAVGKMRDMVWSIDSRRDMMQDLLDRMREHAEEILSTADVSYHFETTDLRLHQKLPVDVRQHLYLIFKEALTNIVKHSQAEEVKLFLGNQDGALQLRIWDNGTTQATDLPATGLGLANMEMRAKAMNAKLTITRDDGFLVVVRLPYTL